MNPLSRRSVLGCGHVIAAIILSAFAAGAAPTRAQSTFVNEAFPPASKGAQGDFLIHVGKRTVWNSTQKAAELSASRQAFSYNAVEREHVLTCPGGKRTVCFSGLKASPEMPIAAAAAPEARRRSVLHGKAYVSQEILPDRDSSKTLAATKE